MAASIKNRAIPILPPAGLADPSLKRPELTHMLKENPKAKVAIDFEAERVADGRRADHLGWDNSRESLAILWERIVPLFI